MDHQPPERLEDAASNLTANEQETAGQLRLMDPQLVGLYEYGLRLMRQIHQPATVYLLAHCGRELSKGVLQLLLDDEELEVSVQELGTDHRPRIAHALGLPDDHPRVSTWCEVHRRFTDSCHWRYPCPSAEVVHGAFTRFSSFLYGLIAPYFSTERELDSLLEVARPTAKHAGRLHDLQLHLGQRNYFFGHLTNPAWVEPLADAGFFSNPPDRQLNPDQSWRAIPWPEGEYLVEAATHAADAVATVLKAVPLSNDNPSVWNIVARAARRLPPNLAVQMVPALTNALKTVPARFL